MLQFLAGPGASQIDNFVIRENLQVAGEFHPCFCFGVNFGDGSLSHIPSWKLTART